MTPTDFIPQTCNDLVFYFILIAILLIFSVMMRRYSFSELFTFQNRQMRNALIPDVPFGFPNSSPPTSSNACQYSQTQQPNKQVYAEGDGLIGLIYPPRAGPLQTNREFPVKIGSPRTPFVAIYKQAPYLKPYNMATPMC